jgi:site-specific DNA-methyltransferase (adenine-specific)
MEALFSLVPKGPHKPDASSDPIRAALAERAEKSWASVRAAGDWPRHDLSAMATYVLSDAIQWLDALPPDSVHAAVTDPPYGLVEYQDKELRKKEAGRGGVWRVPPAFDGAARSPLPRFTVLAQAERDALEIFFGALATSLKRALVPGGHLLIASNPLLSSITFHAIQREGFEKRGEIIRLVQTLRGGDRPKGAEGEFSDVSMMARSCWEPWGVFRKPMEGTAVDNLRKWGTGGLRRISADTPFKDVIPSMPARGAEREAAPHPSLKPQNFLRKVVRAALPLGIGIVIDPFAGSGSTLAAAQAVGYLSIGADRSQDYFSLALRAFGPLLALWA